MSLIILMGFSRDFHFSTDWTEFEPNFKVLEIFK